MDIKVLREMVIELTKEFKNTLYNITSDFEINVSEISHESYDGFMAFTDGGILCSTYQSMFDIDKFKGFNGETDKALAKHEESYYDEVNEKDDGSDEYDFADPNDYNIVVELGCQLYNYDNYRKEHPNGTVLLYLDINTETPYFREKYSKPVLELSFEIQEELQTNRNLIVNFLDNVLKQIK